MATPVRSAVRQVKPLLSLDSSEARRRALNLYRSWYRQIPYIAMDFDLPLNENDLRKKLRDEFMKHRNVKDIRVIDMLVIKGQMELKETANIWKNKNHVMYYFRDTVEKKPTDFLSKFMTGHD
ncbi:NADH dehydrogenase [ubiquinone] 1 alpha subcomplex subunit 6 [Venturia canescens]|uniref:NADH dehydrogenase [ubiquinone] 1 alpha subcomplex subunit 6 n=1 Tax=Venturia canescens TaxID=32260 RepID=UPI001C9D3886|nr:NADH dehydrogenase [ubiquinone] 1 alpha subcomplex subunit 6 [Venturia canescens]